MHAEGIGIGVHYPAIHLLTFYRQMGFKPGDFPIAEHIGAGIVTLPLFPAMREEDVDRVCAQTARAIRQLTAPARLPNAAIISRG
jgi:dTDP-4-amino-4,6-dideoxygalactose transaminase